MDRTIKFRVWNGIRMLYPDYFGSNAYGSQGQITIGWTNQSYIDLGSIRKEPYEAWEGCTLMQFTGLYDCEGKEIYEGDIVNAYDNNCLDNIGVIEYYQNSFNLVCQDIHLSQWSNAENIYVLGNIYEHPELLNK